ncbi:unnamed protein product [Spirodela intermedia]|uniref:protein-serine/threonine phosphatase n=1 Tax=Spirodela intermedia TaxID=51605 RepID=A0A7I8L7D3_SPIIN|nr:unnamed protein product [Spirodela intermedia]
MARDGALLGEEDEGDISYNAVEGVPEEDVKRRDFPRTSRSGRVWMGDPMRFSTMLGRNYAANLYNFAWAQAVQNKPLVSFVPEEATPMGSGSLNPGEDDATTVPSGQEDGDLVENMESSGPVEKEEGELEEGEITLASGEVDFVHEIVCDPSKDAEQPVVSEGIPVSTRVETSEGDYSSGDFESETEIDFDALVVTTLEELEAINEEYAEKCFDEACFRLCKTLDGLQKMVAESSLPVVDALLQQALMGVQTVYSVYMTRSDQNRKPLFRLLSHLKNRVSAMLKPEQMEEVNEMMQSLACAAVDRGIETAPQQEPRLLCSTVDATARNNNAAAPPKLPLVESPPIPKIRVDYHPLLDLHANHDENSLPSPTRDGVPPLLDQKTFGEGPREPAPQPVARKKDEYKHSVSRTREKDGTTFSTYQQKYFHASFLPSNELPSPTPSEECNGGDGDFQEVSSSLIPNAVTTVGSSVSLQPGSSISDTSCGDNLSRPGLIPSPMEWQVGPGINLVAKASLKSRDPRLKHSLPPGNGVNSDGLTNVSIAISRKQKFVDESVLENHNLKRQRNESPDRNDLQISTRKDGWIEDNGALVAQQGIMGQPIDSRLNENRKIEKAEANPGGTQGVSLKETIVRNDPAPAVSSSPMVSLLSLLKDFAGDSTILTHLVKEKQRLAVETQLMTANLGPAVTNPSIRERTPEAVPSTSGPPPRFLQSDQKIDGKIKVSSQTTQMEPQDGAGKIRMKSRDPRRILHSNMLQKSEGLGNDQSKAIAGPSNTDRNKSTTKALGEPVQAALSPPQLTLVPNAPNQFNKGVKNIADATSASLVAGCDFSGPQTASQSLPTKVEMVDARTAAEESNDQQKASTSKSSDPWGDMEHLLDGYDELQKAAIQRERARRIEEQNRMIADRKLCLVLDLDHTLLNSAKFSEVDQVHEEILRRKEEQDREKPQRSLFRFPHMGMWTKLRPGIWNFLEKTSKLFELHLYTMGNKLYATEMAKVLDPTGVLFAGRVISKGDDGDLFDGDERLPKSKDLDGVLGMESAVVIIDDSLRVWPHHKLNLIVVERYTYFPCSRRQFGMPGPSLLDIDHDERVEDGTLASALAVIERIHRTFFADRCPAGVDVRNIIAAEQRRILAGCRIVFSRIFPVGEANPHLHPLWQIAEQFGATCTNQIDDQVTHVVANSLGTDKVNWALSTGRFVVYPGWVEASALLYRRASELDFAIKQPLAQPP